MIPNAPKLTLAAALLLSAFSLEPSALLAQGVLTPPGAPAPTMKTLDQVYAKLDPRTPISSAPFTISVPGSYYLTTNVTVSSGDAISIATNGVTLDLSGFTIASTAPAAVGYGIRLNGGLRNLTILNGFIQGGVTNNGSGVYNGPGFLHGIYYYFNPMPANTRVAGVSVSGCLANGIYPGLGDSTVVESCTVRTVGSAGIVASTVKGSMALDCGGQGISGETVSDSRGESTSGYDGLDAGNALNCYGVSSSGTGLYTTLAANCSGSSTSGYGLVATTAQSCSGFSSSGPYGLDAYTALNCYGFTTSGSYGLYANTAQNCWGYNGGNGTGLRAVDVAMGCRGASLSGIGVFAYIANSCRVASGTTNITFKYNMP